MQRLLSSTLAITLALAPCPTLLAAPPPDAAADEAPPPDEDFEAAKQLFDAGVASYTASDYGAAVEAWTQANALLPPTFDNRLIKAELIYNIARAQQKWFEIDGKIEHLRAARDTIRRYGEEIELIYPADQLALERQKVDEQVSELDAAIAEAEEAARQRELELAERMRPAFDEKADARERKRNKSMIGVGAAFGSLGLGGVGMLVAGIAMSGQATRAVGDLPLGEDVSARADAIAKGEAGNVLQVLGGLSAGLFLAIGVPVLAVGLVGEKKRKQRRVKAGLEAAAPVLLPGGGGFVLRARF